MCFFFTTRGSSNFPHQVAKRPQPALRSHATEATSPTSAHRQARAQSTSRCSLPSFASWSSGWEGGGGGVSLGYPFHLKAWVCLFRLPFSPQLKGGRGRFGGFMTRSVPVRNQEGWNEPEDTLNGNLQLMLRICKIAPTKMIR